MRDEMLAAQEDERHADSLGRIVREVWIAWAKEQPTPKPSWLVPYDQLSEPDKEVDRRIGKRLFFEGARARGADAKPEAPGKKSEFDDGNDYPGGTEKELLPKHIGGYQRLEPDVVTDGADILVKDGVPVAFCDRYLGTVREVEKKTTCKVYREVPAEKPFEDQGEHGPGI